VDAMEDGVVDSGCARSGAPPTLLVSAAREQRPAACNRSAIAKPAHERGALVTPTPAVRGQDRSRRRGASARISDAAAQRPTRRRIARDVRHGVRLEFVHGAGSESGRRGTENVLTWSSARRCSARDAAARARMALARPARAHLEEGFGDCGAQRLSCAACRTR
jgi:hypothetical protein